MKFCRLRFAVRAGAVKVPQKRCAWSISLYASNAILKTPFRAIERMFLMMYAVFMIISLVFDIGQTICRFI